MIKNSYTAIATVTNGNKSWDVTIYSGYETINEAVEGVQRFCNRGYNVLEIRIVGDKNF